MEALKFERPEAGGRERRGTLFCLLTLVGPPELPAPVLGRAIFDTLEEEYFADSLKPPLPALEKAAFSAHRRLLGMTLSSHLPQDIDFNLVLAVLWGQVLYLCRLGSAACYLLRDGKVSEVYLGDEALVSCASGFVYSGDTLILGSKDFKTQFPAGSVAENLLRLEEKMISLSGKETLAAMVLKVEIEEHPGLPEAINFTPAGRELTAPRSNVFKKMGRFLRSAPRLSPPRIPKFGRPGRLFAKKLLAPLAFASIFAVFVGSVYFTISRQSKMALDTKTQKVFADADLQLVSASDMIGVGTVSGRQEAEATLRELLSKLEELENLRVKDLRLSTYLSRTQELLAKVTKEKPVFASLVYDFSLVEKNIKPGNLAGTKDILFVGSSQTGAVFKLNLAAPAETQAVDGGKISSPTEVSAFADNVFVLSASGVSVIKTKTKEVSPNVIASFSTLKFSDFASFGSNLYFLDSTGGQILRALYGEGGYSKPTNWLKEPVNLERAANFAINGFVYVLLSDGKVLKFEGGRLAEFSLSGYSKTLSKSTYIYTDGGLSSVYLVDPDNKKIIEFDEKGAYVKTYDFNGSEVSAISSLYINPDSLNFYVLSGAKVYEVKP